MKKAILNFVAAIATVAAVALAMVEPVAAAEITDIYEEINVVRESYGLDYLYCDPALEIAAEQRAYEASLCWSHTRPNGTACFTVCSKAKGENLSQTSELYADEVTMWMASPAHRDNILWDAFASTGIGQYVAPDGIVYTCQLFGY